MKNFSYILVAILAYLMLSSKSCESDRKDSSEIHEAELTKAMVDLKNEFKSDELSKKSLRAYEVKARQKLVDFSDYLSIYSVKPIDESFRIQARQMILDLFVSDHVRINALLLNESDRESILIGDFLSKNFGYNSIKLVFDSVKIAKPLCRSDGINYAGNLRFSRSLKTYTSSDTLISTPVVMEVEFFVSKIKKSFGNDTLQIWNVSLGSIQ
jgi:hypothetical protein